MLLMSLGCNGLNTHKNSHCYIIWFVLVGGALKGKHQCVLPVEREQQGVKTLLSAMLLVGKN